VDFFQQSHRPNISREDKFASAKMPGRQLARDDSVLETGAIVFELVRLYGRGAVSRRMAVCAVREISMADGNEENFPSPKLFIPSTTPGNCPRLRCGDERSLGCAADGKGLVFQIFIIRPVSGIANNGR
jgi:hypothetical protein